MSTNTQTGISILGGAILLGVVGDILLDVLPWGINVVLFTVALVVTLIVLHARGKIELSGGGRWLFVPALIFATLFAWRDSGWLAFANMFTLLVVLGLMAFRARAGQIRVAGLFEYGIGLVITGIEAAFGAFALLFHTIKWQDVSASGSSRLWLAVGRGILFAIPLLCIFGGLFVAADAVFEGLLRKILNLEEIFKHLFWILVLSWLAMGYLRQTLMASRWESLDVNMRPVVTSGIVEMVIVLGLLNALFLAFVVVQFVYFFGGASFLEISPTLTYAEYARRGFFELVIVAALVLPVLLLADWVIRRDQPAHLRIFRALEGTLIALLFVVMVSAWQRMRLYTDAYGLTELRIYTTAFMGWLALVFIWFLFTVLREQRARFAFGALVTGMLVVVALNAVNPDELIVQTNVGRVQVTTTSRVEFDAPYVTTLSADAVPALVASLPQMKKQDACLVATRLLQNFSPPQNFDLRTWNYSRLQAWWAVINNGAVLKQTTCSAK